MEFVESMTRSGGSARMTRVTIVTNPERSNWVSVSNQLANQLLGLNTLPVILQLRVLDAAGLPSKQAHHVAWTGGVLHGSGSGASLGSSGSSAPGGGLLGLPAALAACLGLQAGAAAQVLPVLGLPAASVVEVEPVSADDWEVVEGNAGFLEEQILPQVGVLARGQLFPLWARAGAALRLRATATQPADLVRLVPGCEVRVAPKLRTRPAVGGERQGQGQGQGQGQTGGAATVVPLGNGNSSSSNSGSSGKPFGSLLAWQQQEQQQQQQGQGQERRFGSTPLPRVPSSGGNGPSGSQAANGGFPGYGYSNGYGTGTRGGSPYQQNYNNNNSSNGSGSSSQSPRHPDGAGGSASTGATDAWTGGLQARPAWAGAVARPSSGRLAPDPVLGSLRGVAAAVAEVEAATAACGGGSGSRAGSAGSGPASGAGRASQPGPQQQQQGGGSGASGVAGARAAAGEAMQADGGAAKTPGSAAATAAAAAGGSASSLDDPGLGESGVPGRGDGKAGAELASCTSSSGIGSFLTVPNGTAAPHRAPATAAAAVAAAGGTASDPTTGSPSQPSQPPHASQGHLDKLQPARQQQHQQLQQSQQQTPHPQHPQQQQQQHRHQQAARQDLAAGVPQPLRLRVLDLPPAKYLVPLPPPQPLLCPVSSVGDNGSSEAAGGDTSRGAALPASEVATAVSAAAVSAWLTLAVAVAPSTAAALTGGAPVPPASDGGGSGMAALVRLHGRGTVRDLLAVLVSEPACPSGHVMLAPPLQHVLCVLPHMRVTVTALPPLAAAAAEAAPLPTLTLHPLPVPSRCFGAAGDGSGDNTTAADAADGGRDAVTAGQSGGTSPHYQQALSSVAGTAAVPAVQASHDMSLAVQRWLAAQMDGIRRAVLSCSCGCPAAAAAGGKDDTSSSGSGILLPLASGTVVHFRIHAAAAAANKAAAETAAAAVSDSGHGISRANGSVGVDGEGLLASAPPGDYCLIVHAGRRTASSVTPSTQPLPPLPPLVSERMLAALLASAQSPLATTALAATVSAPAAPGVVSLPSSQKLPTPTPQLSPQPAVKLGQPVVLPEVSYASSRHATVLAVRQLPPPPPAPPSTPALQSTASASTEATTTSASNGTQIAAAAAAPVQEQQSGAGEPRYGHAAPLLDLGLDLEHISWLEEPLERCLRRLLPQLDPRVAVAVARAGLPRCGGVLVTGQPGSGRSQLLAALGDVAERLPRHCAHVLHVKCGQLAGGSHGSATSALSCLASEALACAPCLLLLDDLDLMCPAAAEGSEYGTQHPEGAAAASRLADWLSALLDELAAATAAAVQGTDAAAAAAPPAIAVVAAAKDAAAVHAALRRVGRLDFEVRLPTPGSRGRAAMLAAAARQRGVAVDAAQLAATAAAAEGYEGVDLRLLLDRAVHQALRRQLSAAPRQHSTPVPQQQQPRPLPLPPASASEVGSSGTTSATAAAAGAAGGAAAGSRVAASGSGGGGGVSLAVTEGDLRAALQGFVPAAFWGVQQAAAVGGKAEGWEDVGGLAHVICALREALLLPIRHRQLVAGAPLRLRTGALLYGPPGCGKTHVVGAAVAAVAKIAPVRFLSVKGPELLNKYIGASEAAVRDLFARAAAAAPAVLFFDEFDAIAPPRGHDSTGVTDRVVNQLLTELDGVEGLRGVVVLAATSRPDLIDAALLRPGRLDRALFCGPPEGPGQRLEILRALSRKLPLAPDVELGRVAEATEGMTGADLGAVLSEAQLHAINEALEAAGEPLEGAAGGPEGAAAAVAAQASSPEGNTATEGAAGVAQQGTRVGVAGKQERSGASRASGGGDVRNVGSGVNTASNDSSASGGSAAAANSSGAGAGAGPVICMRHLLRALEAARPSLPPVEAARLDALYARFRQDREAPGSRQQGLDVDAARKEKRATLA